MTDKKSGRASRRQMRLACIAEKAWPVGWFSPRRWVGPPDLELKTLYRRNSKRTVLESTPNGFQNGTDVTTFPRGPLVSDRIDTDRPLDGDRLGIASFQFGLR